MIERDDESAEFWNTFDLNFKKINNGEKTKIKIRKIK